MKKILIICLLVQGLSGCGLLWGRPKAEKTIVVQQYANDLELEPVPGSIHGPWAETMQQDLNVPGAIDSKGVYYRMPHKAIVEIRQEKYQRAKYPDPDGVYRERE